jgi:hypothetical protein
MATEEAQPHEFGGQIQQKSQQVYLLIFLPQFRALQGLGKVESHLTGGIPEQGQLAR